VQQQHGVDGSLAAAATGIGASALPVASVPARQRLPGSSAAVEVGHAAGQAVLDLSTLDEASPQGFCLADASLEELADCFAVVGGTRLPLHSQVLGAQSQVLRGLFLSLKEGAISAEVCGALCWRCACWLTMGIPPALPLPALHTPPIRIRFFRCVAAGGAYCQCRLISSFSKCHCARRRLLPAPDLLPR
jgi:hypothetical protein